jgi:hypothetical protein
MYLFPVGFHIKLLNYLTAEPEEGSATIKGHRVSDLAL